ncbi:MAG TPA: hypothetical protein VHM91_16380 [Verrucomicrobiales bacterium]|jgi:hypothetical protein|nr:hypothetical protein [Verrucomicrobiales bacterium]
MDRPVTRRSAIVAGTGAILAASFARAVEKSAAPSGPSETSEDPAVEELNKAERAYQKALEAAKAGHRKSIARMLALADRVEGCLLDFDVSAEGDWKEMRTDSKEWFVIAAAQAKTKILKSIVLKPEQVAGVVKAMSATLRSEDAGEGALCHFPIHGLRFFKGEVLLYYTSLCWLCGNYFVVYPDYTGIGYWHGLGDGGRDLEKLMKTALPVPDEEMKRFSKMYPHAPKAK